MTVERLLVAALFVLAFSVVASWFTRRRWVAVLAGTAVALGFLAVLVADARPNLIPGVAAHLASAAALLAAGWLLDRLRRSRGARPSAPPGSVAFVRHWRGEDGLGWALLRPLALLVALGCAAGTLGAAPMYFIPRTVTGAIVVAWLVALPLLAWGLVGTWRAAGRHVAEGGSRLVGWPVKLLTLFGTLLYAGLCAFEAVPDLKEYWPVAFGPAQREKYSLRFLRQGTEVELRGELAWGIGADFEAALASHPTVRIVHLDSGGGRVFEGRRLAESIRGRKLTTYVAHECQSACVRAFAAGEERWLSGRAVVGLHQASGHRASRAGLRRTTNELTEYLAARGIDRAFAERGAATPAEEMWQPSHEELIRARFATRFARPDEVALSGYSEDAVARLDLSLREQRWFQALFEFERPVFDRVVAAMRNGIRDGRSEAEVLGFLDDDVERILDRDLRRTSDAAAHRFYVAFLAAGRAAKALGGRACADFLKQEPGRGPTPSIAPDVQARLLDAMGDVMAGAALDPMPGPEEDAVAETLLHVYAAASERVEDVGVLDEEGAAAERPGEYCDAMLAVAQEIVALPPREAGPLVRYLMAQ